MRILQTSNEVLSIADLPVKKIPVPAWKTNGEDVGVLARPLIAKERAEIEQLWNQAGGKPHPLTFREELLRRTLVTPDGQPLFDKDTVKTFCATKSAAAVEQIFEAVAEMNAFYKRDIEALEGN